MTTEQRSGLIRRPLPEPLKRTLRRWMLQAIADPGRALRARDDAGLELEAESAEPGPTFVQLQLVVDDLPGPAVNPDLADVVITVGAAIDQGARRGATLDELLEVLAVVGLLAIGGGKSDLAERLARREMLRHAAAAPRPPFTCPRCSRASFNPNDAREGYCGACHDWTGAVCEHCGSRSCDCSERLTCARAGELGHMLCGRCSSCGEPRFSLCEHMRTAFLPAR